MGYSFKILEEIKATGKISDTIYPDLLISEE